MREIIVEPTRLEDSASKVESTTQIIKESIHYFMKKWIRWPAYGKERTTLCLQTRLKSLKMTSDKYLSF